MTKEEEQDEKDPFLSFRTEQLSLFVISTIPPHPQNRGGGGGEIYRSLPRPKGSGSRWQKNIKSRKVCQILFSVL